MIVDDHSSHVNKQFIDICDENHIILAILPPHSTHRLQPLDLKIFSPLLTVGELLSGVLPNQEGTLSTLLPALQPAGNSKHD